MTDQSKDPTLFEMIDAIDRKEYDFFDKLTVEQQSKVVPFMLLQWMSSTKSKSQIQEYYLNSVNYHANKYFFNEHVSKHPKLLWMMLCASSPGIGKQYHQWIPQIRDKVSKLKDSPTKKEMNEYFTKIYGNLDKSLLNELTTTFIDEHKKKKYLATRFPNMKLSDIESMSQLVTDDEIATWEKESGNT